jgi:glyceraldehyde 3-phosphate dehydrogenase
MSLSRPVNIGINGFGRIGRLCARIMVNNPNINLAGINSGHDVEYMAYQLKYDSVHGRFKGTVETDGTDLVINGKRIRTSKTRVPAEIPWKDMGVDYLCESTGTFLDAKSAEPHVANGVKKVIFSAPAKDNSPTFVVGVNHELYTKDMTYVSSASCTTHGLAPLVKAIHDAYGIEEGLMTTVHAMTASQKVVDSTSKKDWRGGRGGSVNIIPASTGAAKALALVIPDMKGKMNGMALRVPVADISLVDVTVRLSRDVQFKEVCAEIRRRSEGDLKGILGYTNEKVVSTDFVGCELSSIFDEGASMALNDRFMKFVAWYDNEYGYANRIVDLMMHMAKVDGHK